MFQKASVRYCSSFSTLSLVAGYGSLAGHEGLLMKATDSDDVEFIGSGNVGSMILVAIQPVLLR